MLIEESKRRQSELKELLFLMATDCMGDVEVRKMVIKLKALYSNNFRHNYSEIFPLIVEIAKNENSYSLDYLSNNLEAMRVLVENDYVAGEKEFKGLYQPLKKLSDHINLEIGRYSYYSVNEQKISDLEKKNLMLQTDLKKATEELTDAKQRVSTVQTDLIAVLSIFAAIVLTFSGSMTLISSVFSEVATAPVFKSILFLLLCGLVVSNVIFLMLYIVGKITNRNIYARCKTKDCSCDPQCCGIIRIKNRLPYIFWLNVMFIVLIVIDFLAWYLNSYYYFLPMIVN